MTILIPWTDVVDRATAHLSSIDPVMAGAIARVGPCTLAPNPNVFETLVDAIISQQISVKAADALRAAGLSLQKTRYILDLTGRVASRELELERLSELDDEAVITELIAVKGIGRWTAEMILMFSLGRPDVLPVDDLGFQEGVREAYGLESRPTRKELLERGEAWHPYRSIATWYMWGIRRLSLRIERERTRIVSL